MSPSRVLIVLGTIGGFAAGIGIALYLTGSPLPAAGPVGPASASSPGNSAPADPAAASSSGSDAAAGPTLTGPELVQKFWDCLTMPDEADRQRSWLGMLNKLTKEDAAEVRALFKKMDRQGRWFVPEWDAFWPRWGVLDGAAAIASVEKNEGEEWKPYFADKILRGWAQGDPEAALQWLRDHRESPMYGNGVRSYVDGLAKRDLDRATQFVLGEKAEDTAGHLGSFMTSLAERALQQRMVGGMTTWFSALPESPAKTAAVDAVAFRLTRADPVRAMEWVGDQATQAWRSDKAISDLAEKVAQGNPQGALDWATKLPPSPASGRYNGLSKSVQALAAKDSAAVETWLADPKLDPAIRDQATIAYTAHLFRTQSPNANQWLEKLPDRSVLSAELSQEPLPNSPNYNARLRRASPAKAVPTK
jgi:hypothetical protein